MSVPLPKNKKVVEVIYMSRNPSNKPIKYQLQLDVDARIRHVKDALYPLTKVPSNALRVLEVCDSQVLKIFDQEMSIAQLSSSSQIVVCEVLTTSQIGEQVKELLVQQRTARPARVTRCSYCQKRPKKDRQLKRCVKCFRSAYCDQSCQKKDWSTHKTTCKLYGDPIGCPFIVSLPVSQLTYQHLYELVDAYARHSVNAFQPPPQAGSQPSPSADILEHVTPASSDIVDCGSTLEAMDIDDYEVGNTDSKTRERAVRHVLGTPQQILPVREMPPFCIETNPLTGSDKQLIVDIGDCPLDLSSVKCLNMVWNNEEKADGYVIVETKPLDCVEDVLTAQMKTVISEKIDLHDCLRLFCEPEVLDADQTWYCPRCKLHCRATKEMSLWRLPQNLIIHLKRFSFANILRRKKLEDYVGFPLRSLDVTPYYRTSVERGKGTVNQLNEPAVYDLYGVVNHYGGMLGGHYTSFARTPHATDCDRNELGWREFDDSTVKTISESSVVSRSAYILFYRLRKTRPIPIPETLPSPVMRMSGCTKPAHEVIKNRSGELKTKDVTAPKVAAAVPVKVFDVAAWQTDMEAID
jgi:ubiquitin carboxyl-terminal hydrolase 19